jgi:hypothetical protein
MIADALAEDIKQLVAANPLVNPSPELKQQGRQTYESPSKKFKRDCTVFAT